MFVIEVSNNCMTELYGSEFPEIYDCDTIPLRYVYWIFLIMTSKRRQNCISIHPQNFLHSISKHQQCLVYIIFNT